MLSQREDLTFGNTSETGNLGKLESYFETKLKINGGFATMDYTNEAKTIYVELKTRRVKHDQYPTTIVGINKINFCKDEAKSYYFVFCFLDGLYAIKYNKELFDTFNRDTNYWRKARSDCPNVQQSVIHIPVDKLMKID